MFFFFINLYICKYNNINFVVLCDDAYPEDGRFSQVAGRRESIERADLHICKSKN